MCVTVSHSTKYNPKKQSLQQNQLAYVSVPVWKFKKRKCIFVFKNTKKTIKSFFLFLMFDVVQFVQRERMFVVIVVG